MDSRVVICGIDTSKIPRLNSVELADLMNKLKQGDEIAKQKFIYHNYRLVLSITHRFNAKRGCIDDIFQVGVIGLIKAINNFDTSLNLKFSTYAVPMICGEIRRYLRDNSFLRVSRSLKDLAYQILKTKEDFTKKYSKEPTHEQLSVILKTPLNLIFLASECGNEPISIFESMHNSDGDNRTLLEEISDSSQDFEKQIEYISLHNAIHKLDSKEREIISKRYFEGKTQIEVSDEVGISQAQVSRLEKNALKTIEDNL